MRQMILLVFLLGAGLLAAAELPEIRVPAFKGGIVIDGETNDPGWKDAAVIRLNKPPFGATPEERKEIRPTEVRLAYDSRFLYVSFFCSDGEVIPAGEKHDDLLHAGDVVEIFIDGAGDARQFYEIQLNAKALVRDVNYLFTGEHVKLDRNGLYTDWGNVWDDPCFNFSGFLVAAKLLPEGWYVECAIPAKELMRRRGKGTLAPGDVLRANFVRLDYKKDRSCVMSFWSPTMPGRPHRSPGRMGTLILDHPITPEIKETKK